jgi:L-serine deaminase
MPETYCKINKTKARKKGIMKKMIENLINGNLKDAKKQAKRFKQADIMQYCIDNGMKFEKAVASAMWLKNQIEYQQYCDAE